ncbi:MAG TPA: hypothetical protein VHO01_07980 [Jatrophihabitans sp.]|nr:hypothetical protein [Jatrophihabitans sp.]
MSNERCAISVNRDGVHQSTVVFGPRILVAQRRSAEGAATPRFVLHLGADVLATHPYLHFIHDVGNALHGVGPDAFTEVFLGRHELHPHRGKLSLGDAGVDVVAKCPRAHVDDDAVDLPGMLLDEVE